MESFIGVPRVASDYGTHFHFEECRAAIASFPGDEYKEIDSAVIEKRKLEPCPICSVEA